MHRQHNLALALLLLATATSALQPQCSWWDHNSLRCFVHPGHNLIVEDSVAGRGPEHAKSLYVSCENSQGHVLSDGLFMSVKNLVDLHFEECVVSGITPGAFDYLPHLVNFTLHAGSSAQKAGQSLAIKDALRTLHKLQHLDLASTNLQIPNDFLCLLPGSVTHLNLSETSLRDLRGISPSDPTTISHCGAGIIEIDLSSNQLSLLPPATFSSLSKLETLFLDSNNLITVAERALLGLISIRTLSLSGNSIKSLAPQFFKDNRYLQEIYLQNNSISIIAPGLFTNLEHLFRLDLSHNALTSDWVNSDTFRGVKSLNYLNLAHNQLTRIDSGLFRDLTQLQVLLLSHNMFKAVSASVCGGPSYSLRFLALDNNKIDNVAIGSFDNCTRIEDLNLSGNRLSSVPASLSSLLHLRYVDLGENNITNITNAPYQRLHNLNGLRLTDNSITTIYADSFRHLTSLKIVNLAKNNISSIEPGAFDHNLNLQALRLDSNNLNDANVSQLVLNLKNLLWLSLNENKLTQLNYEELPGKLQWIELSSNRIEKIIGSIENSRITKLDLSENLLTEIGSAQLPDSLVQLSLRNNSLNIIQPYTFLLKENITLIDLSNNKLTNLDRNALRLNGIRTHGVSVLLNGNEFICDCSMQWMQEASPDEFGSDYYPTIADAVKCNPQPYSTEHVFLCKYQSRCAPSCHCCGFNCDCELTCPESCSCYNDQSWSVNIVDCSNLKYSHLPNKIPVDATELRLDGNFLPNLEANSFFQHKYLRYLYLNSSQIEFIANKSFHGLHQLSVLHLENNFIERLDGGEFTGLNNLEELYLQQNSLYFIGNDTFSKLTRLRVLWLNQNNFVSIRIWEVLQSRIPRLAEVRLGGNDYSCQCDFFSGFRGWLAEYGSKVRDLAEVHCVESGRNSDIVLVKVLDGNNPACALNISAGVQSTNLSVLEPQSDDNSSDLIIPLIVGVVGLVVLIVLFLSLSMYWREPLQIWFHANCGLRLHVEPTEDKLFDAFISYSCKDEAWVRQVLASELERHSPPYRLCLRYRDIPIPGSGTYLADTLVSAFEASRRTILVLSHHFLKGEWPRIEVKSAHAQLFKDRSHRVLILILGELPPNIDPEMRLYLKTHAKYTIHCDDKRFWDKLRYAMPDVKLKVPLVGQNGRPGPGRANGRSSCGSSGSGSAYNYCSTNSTSAYSDVNNPNMIVCNNTGNNRSRHVAIHI